MSIISLFVVFSICNVYTYYNYSIFNNQNKQLWGLSNNSYYTLCCIVIFFTTILGRGLFWHKYLQLTLVTEPWYTKIIHDMHVMERAHDRVKLCLSLHNCYWFHNIIHGKLQGRLVMPMWPRKVEDTGARDELW